MPHEWLEKCTRWLKIASGVTRTAVGHLAALFPCSNATGEVVGLLQANEAAESPSWCEKYREYYEDVMSTLDVSVVYF